MNDIDLISLVRGNYGTTHYHDEMINYNDIDDVFSTVYGKRVSRVKDLELGAREVLNTEWELACSKLRDYRSRFFKSNRKEDELFYYVDCLSRLRSATCFDMDERSVLCRLQSARQFPEVISVDPDSDRCFILKDTYEMFLHLKDDPFWGFDMTRESAIEFIVDELWAIRSYCKPKYFDWKIKESPTWN